MADTQLHCKHKSALFNSLLSFPVKGDLDCHIVSLAKCYKSIIIIRNLEVLSQGLKMIQTREKHKNLEAIKDMRKVETQDRFFKRATFCSWSMLCTSE